MSTTAIGSAASSATTPTTTSSTAATGINSLTPADFIQMLVAELSNQDPTSPMDTSSLMDQIAQIGTIDTSQQLSTSIAAMQTAQNMTTGSSLLNKTVQALNTNSVQVTGTVSSVSVKNGAVSLTVGNSTVDLSSVTAILGTSATNALQNILNGLGTSNSTTGSTTGS